MTDLDDSIEFYERVLGFELLRRDDGYASIRSGSVTLGLGPISKLPDQGGYFTRGRLAVDRGAGVEIVLEVDDLHTFHQRVLASDCSILHPLQNQPWGLTDFRITDPDGYYLRITSRS